VIVEELEEVWTLRGQYAEQKGNIRMRISPRGEISLVKRVPRSDPGRVCIYIYIYRVYIYVCVCVCVYIYIYIYIYIYTHTHTYIYIYIYIYIHIYTYRDR